MTAETPVEERPFPFGPARPTTYAGDDHDDVNEEFIVWAGISSRGEPWPEFARLPCEYSADEGNLPEHAEAAAHAAPGPSDAAVPPAAPARRAATTNTAARPRRPRRTPARADDYNARREDREAAGDAGTKVLEVAGALGAFPLKLLVHLAASRANVSAEQCYRAVRGLTRAGLLAVWTPREAGGLEPCEGLLKIAALTQKGADACLARAITRRPDTASFQTKRRAVEQLVLSGAAVHRVASRWSAVTGPDALLRLATYASDRAQHAPRRNWYVREYECHKLFTLRHGERLTALLPPEPGGVPAVLFGGSWTERRCLEGDNRPAMATAAPYQILCAALGTVVLRQVRKHRRGRRSQVAAERRSGRVTVERLPDKRGPAWRELWRGLSTLLVGEDGADATETTPLERHAALDRVNELIDRLLL